MLPSLFSTQEEILKKLKSIARVHDIDNVKSICHIFYDVFKIAYYALENKKAGLKSPIASVTLKREEITSLVRLIDYHHSNDKTFTVQHELIQCFGPTFTEADALDYFEKHVEGEISDKFGRIITVDLENGIKFMYKDYETQKHDVRSENYLPHRGKRLPWIRHTIRNSTNIYAKISGDKKEVMYLCKYDLPIRDGENNKCYWVVIAKKYVKDKTDRYKFKTAFPIFKYNDLLRRLERYEPVPDLRR